MASFVCGSGCCYPFDEGSKALDVSRLLVLNVGLLFFAVWLLLSSRFSSQYSGVQFKELVLKHSLRGLFLSLFPGSAPEVQKAVAAAATWKLEARADLGPKIGGWP